MLPARARAPAARRAPAPRRACGAGPPRAAARAGAHPPPPPSPLPPAVHTDFLVLGSGIAGLTFALKAAPYGRVAVVTKGAATDGCTAHAQGGISAVLSPLDTIDAHIADTLAAGDGACDPAAVAAVAADGAAAVLELAALGARFDADPATGGLHLTREGGHSARRVAHAADATGAEVVRALLAAARAHPNITLHEGHAALDLVKGDIGGSPACLGADTVVSATGDRVRFAARATVLATGGAGRAFPLTTNPEVATGDGLAMALRAGALAANLEFVQFHPTALAVGARGGRAFLVTEAARGEGGVLRDVTGRRFMTDYDPRGDLAPRDVVARAIADVMRSTASPHVLLDVTHLGAATLLSHFPTVTAACRAAGVDPATTPVPVAPAQHYMCGGVTVGGAAQTTLAGLFAVGEAAHTGLHGANRLASNSLLEGLVYARAAADPGRADGAVAAAARAATRGGDAALAAAVAAAPTSPLRSAPPELAQWAAGRRADAAAALGAAAGIVRTRAGLAAGAATLHALSAEIEDVASSLGGGGAPWAMVELANVATVGRAVLACALARRESRGGHWLADAQPPPAGRPRPPNPTPTTVSLADVDAACAVAADREASRRARRERARSPAGSREGARPREVAVRSETTE